MTPTPEALEAARTAIQAVLDDLTDRKGLRQEWEAIDDDIRAEILSVWSNIFATALADFAARAVEGEQPDPLTDAAGQEAIRIGTLFGGLLSSSALGRLEVMVAKAIRDAVEGEREACAVLADNHYSEEHDQLRLGVTENTDITTGKMGMAFDLARLIRARGSEKP